MSLIRASNSLTDVATKSFLAAQGEGNDGTIQVRNLNTFTANWAIQIGNTGEENSEVQVISSLIGTSQELVLVGSTTYDHPVDTPVYAIKYNQVIFKRSTAGTAGTATALTNGTVTIQPDQLFTQFDDPTAQAGYAYKASFYNSVTTEETADSDWLTTTGYSFYSRAKIRERIRQKMFDSSFIPDDGVIDNWINEWLEHMNNAAVHVNKDYSIGTANVAFGTAGLGTITATDYKDIRKLEVTTDGVTYYTAQRIAQTDFQPDETFASTQPAYYPYGDSVFGVKPDGQGGTARVTYYTLSTTLDDDGDELPVKMRGYSKSFVDYGLSQALQVDNKPEESAKKLSDANNALSQFVSDITPRSYSGPRFIKILDPIDGGDNYI